MLVASHRLPRIFRGACARLLSCALVGVACSAPSASSPAATSEPALPVASGLPTSPGSPEPPQTVTLEGSPAADDVLAAMRLVNAHFVATWPDPTIDIVTDRARPSNLWTRAVYFEGLMALHAVEPDRALKASYYDYAVRWGESPAHPWQVTYGQVTTPDADHHACGQTYLDLFAIEAEPVRIAQLEASIRHLIGSGNTKAWWWIDALQMAMPVFARLGVLRNDASYFDAMGAFYSHSRNVEGGGLFDSARGLWWRDANYTPGDVHLVTPNGSEIYWSRGNGWVLAALARVLEVLPAGERHRATYEADFRALAAALLPLQREDGFWNASLADPTHCAAAGEPGEDGPETSGTALFAYGLGWGIRHGLLDAATYGPPLLAAWNGMLGSAVRDDGFLGWVQPTGAAPCSGPEPLGRDIVPNFEDFGVGCFLLAGSEVARLGRPPHPE
jgi:unsaturated rhamnogalacturonyl hydrolase